MKRRRLVCLGMVIMVATAIAATAQVTREEFDALVKKVRELEAKCTMLEIQNRRQEEEINKLKTMMPLVAQQPQGQQAPAQQPPPALPTGTVDLSNLTTFDATTPARLLGQHVFGTVRVWRVSASRTKPRAVEILGQNVQLNGQFVFCLFDLASPLAMSIEKDEWYRIRGLIKQAQIVPAGQGLMGNGPSLLLTLDEVEATYRDSGSGETRGTFGTRL